MHGGLSVMNNILDKARDYLQKASTPESILTPEEAKAFWDFFNKLDGKPRTIIFFEGDKVSTPSSPNMLPPFREKP